MPKDIVDRIGNPLLGKCFSKNPTELNNLINQLLREVKRPCQ